MKKTITFLTVCLLIGWAILAFTPAYSDSASFEGVIAYSVTFEGNPAATKLCNDSSTYQLYIKGDKSEFAVFTKMNKDTTLSLVINMSQGSMPVILSYILHKKYQLKDQAKNTTSIKYLDETKEFAGYTCHRANTTINTGDRYTNGSGYLFYADDIPCSFAGDFGQFIGLKGAPLQFSETLAGNTMTYVAISVQKKSVSDDHFVTPSGYVPMTMDEMRKDIKKSMFGGK